MSRRPINILYFSSFNTLQWGGQKSLFHLVTRLDPDLYRPHVVVPAPGDLEETLRSHDLGVTILPLPRILGAGIYKGVVPFRTLLKIIDQFQIDLLHTDGPRNTFYAGVAAKIKGLPLIWHIRDSSRDMFDMLLYWLSSKIILVAEALRDRFWWATKTDKFVRIYNGVDLTAWSGKDALDDAEKQLLGIEDDSFLIGANARVDPFKGQRYLIEACGLLKKKIPHFHLLMAGNVADFSYVKECEKRAEELGIHKRVHFLGHRNDVAHILNSVDVFILPSISREAFSRSLIEAMAAGKPAIATDVGGAKEAIEPDVSGFIVSPRDSVTLAERILFLARNREERLRMGEAARIRARDKFSIERNVHETVQLYRDVLERYPRRELNG